MEWQDGEKGWIGSVEEKMEWQEGEGCIGSVEQKMDCQDGEEEWIERMMDRDELKGLMKTMD